MSEQAQMGIKESLEVIAGVKLVGVTARKVFADGKITKEDITPALDLVMNAKILVDAIDGAGEVVKEAKDLDQAELIQIGAAFYDAIKAIKEAK